MLAVEPVAAQDIAAIMGVMESAFDPAIGEAWTAQQVAGLLSIPGTSLCAARCGDVVLGFALWRTLFDDAELLLIAVDPGAHSTGVGTALFKHVATECLSSGAHYLHVEVRTDNPALYFYAKLGFEMVGIRPQYYRRKDNGPTEATTLRCELDLFRCDPVA